MITNVEHLKENKTIGIYCSFDEMINLMGMYEVFDSDGEYMSKYRVIVVAPKYYFGVHLPDQMLHGLSKQGWGEYKFVKVKNETLTITFKEL